MFFSFFFWRENRIQKSVKAKSIAEDLYPQIFFFHFLFPEQYVYFDSAQFFLIPET